MEAGVGTVGKACDIWALGCTLFEIRRQVPLFDGIYDPDEILAAAVGLFGKLPDPWWSKWEEREEWCTNDGKRVGKNENDVATLEVALDNELVVMPVINGQQIKKVLAVHRDEQKILGDLLRRLLRYDPEERPTVEEALQHDWFTLQSE